MLSSPIPQTQFASIHSLHPANNIQDNNTSQKQKMPPSLSVKDQSKTTIMGEDNNSIPLTDNEQELDLPNLTVKIGSRRSQLAVIQSEIVGSAIRSKYPNFKTPIIKVSTLGDQVQNKPLYSFGGKAVWTKELEILLLESFGGFDKIDMIVHSLKDMPTTLPDEFELGGILAREDPRDALVMKTGSPYKSLSELPAGSIVGTSSIRRSAQLLKNHPTLNFKSVRGNINTRLLKLDDPANNYDCLILASAGLIRVGLKNRITKYLNDDEMLYAVGQGALGLEIRKGDANMQKVCSKICSPIATFRCMAERALLRKLEGGCSVPVGVHTVYNDDSKTLGLKAIVLSSSGDESVIHEHSIKVETDQDAIILGEYVADCLIEKGAKKILDEINFEKINEIKSNGLTNIQSNGILNGVDSDSVSVSNSILVGINESTEVNSPPREEL